MGRLYYRFQTVEENGEGDSGWATVRLQILDALMGRLYYRFQTVEENG